MIRVGTINVTAYGSDPEHRETALHISDSPMMSGGGTQPPKKAPIKPTKKPKKK